MNFLYISLTIVPIIVALVSYKLNIVELRRKLIHLTLGITSIVQFHFLSQTEMTIVYSAVLLALLLLRSVFKEKKIIRDIYSIRSGSYGELFYILSILLLINLGSTEQFIVAILSISISDGLAAIIGSRYPIKTLKVFNSTKSLSGSTVFFVSSILILATITTISIPLALLYSLILTIIELLLGYKGLDNLVIALVVLLLL